MLSNDCFDLSANILISDINKCGKVVLWMGAGQREVAVRIGEFISTTSSNSEKKTSGLLFTISH